MDMKPVGRPGSEELVSGSSICARGAFFQLEKITGTPVRDMRQIRQTRQIGENEGEKRREREREREGDG